MSTSNLLSDCRATLNSLARAYGCLGLCADLIAIYRWAKVPGLMQPHGIEEMAEGKVSGLRAVADVARW